MVAGPRNHRLPRQQTAGGVLLCGPPYCPRHHVRKVSENGAPRRNEGASAPSIGRDENRPLTAVTGVRIP
jgi:hypothetical protein